MTGSGLLGRHIDVPRGAAGGRAPGVARRGPRRGRRPAADPVGRPRDRPRRVRRHGGEEAVAADHLRHALRRLLPAARRRGRRPATRTTSAEDQRRCATTPQALTAFRAELEPALGDGDDAGAAAARGRGGRTVRRDARPRARPVVMVGVHRAAAGVAVRPGRPDRRRAARAGPGRGRGATGRRSPDRGVHPDGRGRRPPSDRRGEGARPRGRRRGPPEHRPARLHRRPQGRPRGDARARSTRSPVGSRPG